MASSSALTVRPDLAPPATPGPDAAPEVPFASLAAWPDQLDLRALQAEFGSNIWIVSAPQLAANLAAWARVAGGAARIAQRRGG